MLLVFEGLATGSLLYVVFFEILEKERVKDVNGFAQAMSMTFGYVFMILLSVLEASKSSEAEDANGNWTQVMNATLLNTTTTTAYSTT